MRTEKFEIKDIYPNPSDGYFTFTFISLNGIEKNNLHVVIYNADGVSAFQKVYDNPVSYSQYTIKTGQLQNGIYNIFFSLNNEGIERQIEVLKQTSSVNSNNAG